MIVWVLLHEECDGEEDEVVVELQESVFVSDVEGEKIVVHGLAHEELVIQEAIEDVVAEYVSCTDEDEELGTIAVETCVMSPDDVVLEEEGLQVDVVTDAQVQEDPDTCEEYLMISCEWLQPIRIQHLLEGICGYTCTVVDIHALSIYLDEVV